MKTIKKLSLIILMLGSANLLEAQQTPAKAKTTKAAPAKKTKASGKAGMVFMCEGTNGYTYHSRKTCAKLVKCNGKITEVSKKDAVYSFGKEPCKNCN